MYPVLIHSMCNVQLEKVWFAGCGHWAVSEPHCPASLRKNGSTCTLLQSLPPFFTVWFIQMLLHGYASVKQAACARYDLNKLDNGSNGKCGESETFAKLGNYSRPSSFWFPHFLLGPLSNCYLYSLKMDSIYSVHVSRCQAYSARARLGWSWNWRLSTSHASTQIIIA